MTAESFSPITEPSSEVARLRLVTDRVRDELSQRARVLLDSEWGPARRRTNGDDAETPVPEDN